MTVSKKSLRVGDIIRVDNFPDSENECPENRRVFVVYLGRLDDIIIAAGIGTLHGSQTCENGIELPGRPNKHPETGLTRLSAVSFDWLHPVQESDIIERCGKCPPMKFAAVMAGVQANVQKKLAEIASSR